jgi:hypothetical protein
MRRQHDPTADPATVAPLVIPASAPLITGRRAVVYVQLPDKAQPTFEPRDVLLGSRTGDWYIVQEGLAEGELVVARGAFKIDSELQIRGRPSMMQPEGGPPPTHDHGGGQAEQGAGGGQAADAEAAARPPGGPAPRAFRAALGRTVKAQLALVEALAADNPAAAVAPFDWRIDWLPRNPVPRGCHSQSGREPADRLHRMAGPLAPGCGGPGHLPADRLAAGRARRAEVRSSSLFGFSMIFLIFDEDTRVLLVALAHLEKLNSLPAGLLPRVSSRPGPGCHRAGAGLLVHPGGPRPGRRPVGGWDLHELRSGPGLVCALRAAVGRGHQRGGLHRRLRARVPGGRGPGCHARPRRDAAAGLRGCAPSNLDVGARVTEINRVEYLVRGRGFIKAWPTSSRRWWRWARPRADPGARRGGGGLGPAQRRGALTTAAPRRSAAWWWSARTSTRCGDQQRQGEDRRNRPGPARQGVIDWTANHRRMRSSASPRRRASRPSGSAELEPDGLARVAARTPIPDAWPPWVTLSQLDIVPFYDRTGLIHETLGTLNDALVQQILVTVIVVIVMVLHLRSALVISAMLPLAVLMCFIAHEAVRRGRQRGGAGGHRHRHRHHRRHGHHRHRERAQAPQGGDPADEPRSRWSSGPPARSDRLY